MGFFLALARLFALKSAHSLPETHKILDSNCVLNFTWPHTLRSVHTHTDTIYLARSQEVHFVHISQNFIAFFASAGRVSFALDSDRTNKNIHFLRTRARGVVFSFSLAAQTRAHAAAQFTRTHALCVSLQTIRDLAVAERGVRKGRAGLRSSLCVEGGGAMLVVFCTR